MDTILKIDGGSGYAQLEQDFAALLTTIFELFKRKQASYGPGNIDAFGECGVVVRMYDKIERLKRLVWEKRDNPLEDETITDTYLDIATYALIALLVRQGSWPSASPDHNSLGGI